MNVGWIVFLLVAVPLLVVVVWVVFDDSLVQIEPGSLGLLLVRGRATDRVVGPGRHWVPALRRRMVQVYPSLELSFRAGFGGAVAGSSGGGLERVGLAPRVLLGDRAAVVVSYTVRFRLDPVMLRGVHERFGPEGIWTVVEDESGRTVRGALARPGVGVEDLFGPGRVDLERGVGAEVGAVLGELGLVVTMFGLGDVDLGATGDVIQATARAGYELARERAEAPMRVARAEIDADLVPLLGEAGSEVALRYREIDSWQQVVRRGGLVGGRGPGSDARVDPAAAQAAAAAADAADAGVGGASVSEER